MTRTAPCAISLENHNERSLVRAVLVEVRGSEKRARPIRTRTPRKIDAVLENCPKQSYRGFQLPSYFESRKKVKTPHN